MGLSKLCNKQCRGIRGLVDHMHSEHKDYKPWECHICDVRTTFVKTLYRHLREEHHTKSSPCPRCGMKLKRAQSMVSHVKQVSFLVAKATLEIYKKIKIIKNNQYNPRCYSNQSFLIRYTGSVLGLNEEPSVNLSSV